MESTYQHIGLPDAAGVVLFVFALALALAPYFPGRQIGGVNVPDLGDRKRLFQVVGPILLLLVTAGFLPLWSEDSSASNHKPVARISAEPRAGKVPLAVHLSGQNSFDPDDDNLEYLWLLGRDSLPGREIDHTFSSPGTFRVELEVKDSHGSTDREEAVIRVDSITEADLSVLLMANPRNTYPGLSDPAYTNSDEIRQIMNQFRGFPRPQSYNVPQNWAQQPAQIAEVLEINPDLIVIHRSAFPHGTVAEGDSALKAFVNAMANRRTRLLIYSKSFDDADPGLETYKNWLTDVQADGQDLRERIHFHAFVNTEAPLAGFTDRQRLANRIRSLLREIAREKNAGQQRRSSPSPSPPV